MKYTQFEEADKLVQEYLDIIVREIKNNTPGLRAIILAGGYGRGEGAVEFIKKKPRLLNDIDLYVVSDKQLSDEFLEKLGQKCAKLLGKGGLEYPENYSKKFDFDTFFNVDLRNIVVKRLKILPPTVRYYEMKNATTLLYGEDVRTLIPDIKTEELPFSEGLRFLSNRMMNLFLSMKEEFLKKKPSQDEEGIIDYYICKAYLACCDSLLLSKGKFSPTYSGREKMFSKIYQKEFPKLYKKFPKLPKKVKGAINYKLNPNIKKMNYKKEWFEIREIITAVFMEILTEKMKSQEIPWENINELTGKKLEREYFEGYSSNILNRFGINFWLGRIILSKAIAATLSMLYFLRLKEEKGKFYFKAISLKDPGLKILGMTPLVLLSFRKDGKLKLDYVSVIEKNLEKIYPINKITSWEEMKENYLKAYKLYYLRRFI